jgi:hypothetical protein
MQTTHQSRDITYRVSQIPSTANKHNHKCPAGLRKPPEQYTTKQMSEDQFGKNADSLEMGA